MVLKICYSVLLFLFSWYTLAQDLEPRRWTPIPLDLQVVGVGYGYSSADILFDPVSRIEDASMKLHVAGASYVTSFNIANRLTRFDVTLPWASGEWKGLLNGEPAKTSRVGLMDPKFRVSVNLTGTPAVKASEMRSYLAKNPINTVVGAALSVSVPWGEYLDDRLINLGENRYVIRPQIGVVHKRNKFSYELTGSIFFYTNNDDFYGKQTRKQDPLYAIQTHVIYSMEKGRWVSLSAGYGFGGRSELDGVRKNDERHGLLSALSFGMPISKFQSIKVAYLYGHTNAKTGINSDSFLAAWSHAF